MTKKEFIKKRTEIISKMLDNPNELGIYPTSIAFAELDDLYDRLIVDDTKHQGRSEAQLIRDKDIYYSNDDTKSI